MTGCSLKQGDLVIVRSTVPVGSSRSTVLPKLEAGSGLCCGVGFNLVYAPERAAEGAAFVELKRLPQLVGGFCHEAVSDATALFSTVTSTVVDLGSTEAAELGKLACNAYRDFRFAFANLLAMIAQQLGLDAIDLIESVNRDYPRGDIPLPSPGVGGPCLSKDPYVLAAALDEHGFAGDLLRHARGVNEACPNLVVKRLRELLDRAGKSLQEAKISLVGIGFKGEPETTDLRGSTSVAVLRALPTQSNLRIHDPVVSDTDLRELGVRVVGLEEAFDDVDGIVVLNNHRSYRDWCLDALLTRMSVPAVFLDTWNNFRPEDFVRHEGIIFGGLWRG